MLDLDIVIVNWNAGDKLFECLTSIQQSTFDNSFCLAKCIIVDNASTDRSLENIREMDLPLELLVNTQNKGFGSASNQGARHGTSEYILFLNPDVRLFADTLAKSISFMEAHSDQNIGILGIQMIDEHHVIHRNTARFPTPRSLIYQMLGVDRLWSQRFPPHFMTDWSHRENRIVDQVPGSFFLMRRSLFTDLAGFDERFFMYFEDLDFAYRAKTAGWVNYYLSEVRAFHHGGGTTNQVRALRLFYVLRSRIIYAAKHFGYSQAIWIVIASLTLEVWVRLLWNLIHLSGKNFLETLEAYFLYIKGLPALVKKIKK